LAGDTLTYHATKAAWFVQQGTDQLFSSPGGWSYYRLFSPGHEVWLAWSMMPFHRDTLMAFVEVLQALGIFLAISALFQRLRAHLSLRYHVALWWLVFSMPLFWKSIATGYVELGLVLAILQAILFTLAFWQEGHSGALILSWLALGVAFAIKLPALPVLGFFALLHAAILWLRRQRKLFVPWFFALLLAFLVNLPWLARNTQETGYPLSPYPLKILGIKLGEANPAMQWYMEGTKELGSTWRGELDILYYLFFPFSTLQTPVFGLFVLFFFFLFPWSIYSLWKEKERFFLLLAAGVIVANLFGFYHADFSRVRVEWKGFNARFLFQTGLLCCFLGVMAAAYRWKERDEYQRRAQLLFHGFCGACVAFFLWGWVFFEGFSRHEIPGIVVLSLMLSGALVVCGWLSLRKKTRLLLGVGLFSFVLVMGVFESLRERDRQLHYQKSYSRHRVIKYFASALPILDRLEQPLRIAFTSGPWKNGDNLYLSVLFGRRFQNQLFFIPETREGRALERDGQFFSRRHLFDREAWLKRLREQRIDYVVSFGPTSLEQRVMEAYPRSFSFVIGISQDWGVFAIHPNQEELRDRKPFFDALHLPYSKR
jgi:hypothetical protein